MEDNRDMIGSFGSDIGNISASNDDKLDQINDKLDRILEIVEISKPKVDSKADVEEPKKEENDDLSATKNVFVNPEPIIREPENVLETFKNNEAENETEEWHDIKITEEEIEDAIRKINAEKQAAGNEELRVVNVNTIEQPTEQIEQDGEGFLDISTVLSEASDKKVEAEPIQMEEVSQKPSLDYSIVKDNYIGMTMQDVKIEAGQQRRFFAKNNSMFQQKPRTLVKSNEHNE